MNNLILLYKELQDRGIPVPPAKSKVSGGCLRWGRNGRFWARPLDLFDGWKVGDFSGEYLPQPIIVSEPSTQYDELTKETKEKMKQLADKALKTRAMEQAEATKKALMLWCNSKKPIFHEYLYKKHIDLIPDDVRLSKFGELVVPLHDARGNLMSLQFISDDGTKKFCKGCPKKGNFYLFGSLTDAHKNMIGICEGFATGASLYDCLEIPIICAMDAGNLEPTATLIRMKFPNLKILFFADNDASSVNNTGLTKANEAKKVISNCSVLFPSWSNHKFKSVDWNDIYCVVGKEIMKEKIMKAMADSVEEVEFVKGEKYEINI